MPSLAAIIENSRVASRATVEHAATGADWTPQQLGRPMHGTPNVQLFQQAPDKIRPSDEQGVGVGPERQWPHMPHVFQQHYHELGNYAWLDGGDPALIRERPERAPREAQAGAFAQQSPAQHHVWPSTVTIDAPGRVSLTDLARVAGPVGGIG